MELRHLRYLLQLWEQKSFTRAAERLCITQSTLSHQVQQLEEEMGSPLLERHGGGSLTLTYAGRQLIECAQRVMADVDTTVAHLKDAPGSQSGLIRIGATPAFSLTLAPALYQFRRSNPQIAIQVYELSAPEVEQRLLDEQLDVAVAFVPAVSPGLWEEPLFHERLVLLISKKHALASRRRLRISELRGYDLILPSPGLAMRRLIEECFERAGLEPRIAFETNTYGPIVSLLKLDEKLGMIVTERAVPQDMDLTRVLLHDPQPSRTAGLLWKRGRRASASALALVEFLKASIDGNDGVQ